MSRDTKLFTGLRNRFLFLSSGMMLLLVLAAFTTIFVITAGQIRQSIDESFAKLKYTRFYEDRNDRDRPDDTGRIDDTGKIDEQSSDADQDRRVPKPQYSPIGHIIAFSICTDDTGEIQHIQTVLGAEDDFYLQAWEQIRRDDSRRGRFELDDYRWEYRQIRDNGNIYYLVLDVSEDIAVIERLAVTFSVAALVAFAVIFAISFLLTRRAIEPVKTAFEKQSGFISDASHELKTPVAVISANADLLRQSEDPQERQRYIDAISLESRNMTSLIHDLLAIARLDSSLDTQPLAPPCNISREVETILLAFEALAYEQNRTLEYSIHPNLNTRVNPASIASILKAYLENAVKYGTPGTPISITLERRGRGAILSVTNSGQPIPEEERERIFDRFYRSDSARSRQGNSYGLGLSIVKTIADRENLQVSCNSSDSTVSFSLRFRRVSSI